MLFKHDTSSRISFLCIAYWVLLISCILILIWYNYHRSQLVKDKAGFPNGSRRYRLEFLCPWGWLIFLDIFFKILNDMFRIFFYF